MLGWMLRRGEDAPNTANDGDTTQIDQPDTPAPVFAARAFKSALFGTPARPSDTSGTRAARDKNLRTEQDSRTPQRPQGILLTPGTGTTRRKRVSFGQDVKKTADPAASNMEPRQRTRLNDALEKASRSAAQEDATRQDQEDISDDEWEEADDEDYCTHDITIDLNEPHSQSGKYWKEEFEKYHEDAKAEMEKLLKYKQLAKSYAKQKDAEAIDLAVKLKEEQQKVISMEKQIAEGASRIVAKRDDRSDEASSELLSTLTKQTALAVQYRTRVQDLEDQLEQVLREREDDPDSKGRRRRLATSPRTQKTLLETQRELRRARNQVKELGELRGQVSTLKTQLRAAEKRASKAEAQGKTESDAPREGTRAQELRAQLREAREETKKKDDELRQLKQEFEAYRNEAQAHDEDTKGVLERAHNKIAELKREIRTLKTGDNDPAARPNSWHVQSDAGRAVEDGLKKEVPKDASHERRHDLARRSFDLADVEGDSVELRTTNPNVPSLRQKFRDDAPLTATQSEAAPKSWSALEKPNLGRPRWQPFVPRSPRNRAYLGEELTKRIENGGVAPEDMAVPDLPALAKSIARSKRSTAADRGEDKIDLLQNHYARLGGPDANNSTFLANTSKSALPPERRAAAIARIEQRMAEKKRAQRRKGFDKENHLPLDAASDIQNEISELERRLQDARERLKNAQPSERPPSPGPHLASSTHFLLLLSDSALPLGSFAFSSGLESYLAHVHRAASFSAFLPSSLSSFAATTLPFVLAAHRNPDALADLDDQLDAAIVCTVGRRASVAQGRALLGIWERSFRASCPHVDARPLRDFATLLRGEGQGDVPLVSAHLAPLFGAVCSLVGLGLRQTAYVFMLSHVKALISAAVRASVFGPYQAQKVLAGQAVQQMIDDMIDREWTTPVEEAGQTVPVMDLWFGRHEMLYSRIFNS
ncbi:hypothetical protein ACJ41O_013306 [Fusarium nematophilum]